MELFGAFKNKHKKSAFLTTNESNQLLNSGKENRNELITRMKDRTMYRKFHPSST